MKFPPDPKFNEEFKKQKVDLIRKEDELHKIHQVISKKAELLKLENEEKQRLHNLRVERRRLDVRLKLGVNRDEARRMFGLPPRSQIMTESSFNCLITTELQIQTTHCIWKL